MSVPETKLDARFSDPDAVAVSWEDTRQALEAAELFWITTVRRDGRPHVTPLVAVWLDETIYFCTGPSEQKARNLAHNPRVILTTGCNDWEHGLDVVVEGAARPGHRRRAAAPSCRRLDAKVGRALALSVGDGGFEHENGGPVLVFGGSPAKVLAFGKGTFSQTRHRFSRS